MSRIIDMVHLPTDHLPYVAGSYGLALALVLWLSLGARMRSATARRRLAALDPRPRSGRER